MNVLVASPQPIYIHISPLSLDGIAQEAPLLAESVNTTNVGTLWILQAAYLFSITRKDLEKDTVTARNKNCSLAMK